MVSLTTVLVDQSLGLDVREFVERDDEILFKETISGATLRLVGTPSLA
jgi:hypothetical protein